MDIDGCDQQCDNTPGSFNCNCDEGFDLDLDGASCNGMELHLCSWHALVVKSMRLLLLSS